MGRETRRGSDGFVHACCAVRDRGDVVANHEDERVENRGCMASYSRAVATPGKNEDYKKVPSRKKPIKKRKDTGGK